MLNLDYKDVAEKYGGNKQKIAEAAALGALGPEGPLLALAAGQYIDRMRAAQMQEQVPQQTVAQQVFNPQPQMPPQGAPQGAPAMPPQGLGAIAPQGEAPMPMEAPVEEAPMGMAMGGVAGLPVPDDMFDEPSNGGFNDGYAGGGLVAFAGGGELDEAALRRALRAQESSGDYGVLNTQGSGAMGAYQFMPSTARALAKRLGLPYRPELMQGAGGRSKEGIAYQERLMDEQMKDIVRFSGGDPKLAAAYHFAGPNRKGWGKDTAKYQSDILRRLGSKGDESTALVERDMEAPEGRFNSFMDQIGVANRIYGELPEDKGTKEAIAYFEKQRDPKEMEKERKNDMWASLAQIGASMMGTDSPNFLQAVGQAIGGALPGAEASRKERKAMEREAVKALSELYGMERKEAKEKVALARDLYGIEMGAEKEQADRAFQAEQAAIGRKAAADAATIAFERSMTLAQLKEKGLDELAENLYQMGKNEKIAQGLPVDEPALRALAYENALKIKAKYSAQPQQTNMFDATGVGGTSAPAGNAVDFSQLK